MAKFARHLNAFVAGELSPRFYGRTDSQEYQQGAQELLNKIVRAQGGAMRRPGTIFTQDGLYDEHLTRIADFDSDIRMIDFRFSRTDASVVLLSTGDNGLSTYGIAIWVPAEKQWAEITVTLSSGYHAFIGWETQEELDEIQYAQSGDVLALVSKKNPPVFLVRTGTLAYTLRDIYSLRDVFSSSRTVYSGSDLDILQKASPSTAPDSSKPYYNVPYRVKASGSFGTISASATTGTVVLTNSGAEKLGQYIGSIMRLTKSGTTGFVKITDDNSDGDGYTVRGTVLKTLGGTGTQDSWEIQDFGATGEDSWPKCVAFHDQRIWYGNTEDKPNTLWASQVGDFTEMMIVRPADDANFSALSNDRPFSYTLAANQIDDICWFLPSKSTLFIGTTGGEWLGLPGQDNIIGPLFPNFQPQTTYGSKPMQAMNVDGSIVFVDRTGQHLREFTYNRDVDNYRAIDLLYFADHIIRKGLDIYSSYEFPEIQQICWQGGANTIIWVLDSNGMLHALSKERDYGTLAWSTMQFGGALNADGDPPKVKAICCLPNDSANDDDVYILIERYLNGGTKYYLEKIGMEFLGPSLNESSNDIQRQPVYMDACQQIFNLSGPKMFARYTNSIDADYWTTAATGTGTGSPTASSGLVLTGGTTKYVSYNAANAALVQTGTIVLEFTPNYSVPASEQHLLAIAKSNSDDDNLISLKHETDGDLIAVIKDSAGSTIVTLTYSGWQPTQGQKYQIVLSFDATNGKYRMYMNGILVATNGSNPTGTRSSDIAQFVVGTSYNAGHTSNFTINKIGIATSALPTTFDGNLFLPAFAISTYVIGVNHIYGDAPVIGDGQYQGELDLRTENLTTAITGMGLVGLSYSSRVKLMDLEAGSILGSAQGAVKRVHEITARFERTVGAKYGPATDKLDSINFTPVNHTSGTPIPLYTGDHTLKYRPGYSRNLTMIIQQDLPFPCTVTSIIGRGMTSD